MEEKDKIAILLHEYDTLRTEMIHRTNSAVVVLGVIGVLVGWLLTQLVSQQGYHSGGFWVGLAVLIFVAIYFALWIPRDIGRAARHVLSLEGRINAMADETLLTWQSLWPTAIGPNRLVREIRRLLWWCWLYVRARWQKFRPE